MPRKSHALNGGIQAVRGNVVVFMDDDVRGGNVVAESHSAWIAENRQELADAFFLSGKVQLRWLPIENQYALAPLAVFDLGTNPGALVEPPFGAHMAFRKSMLEKYDGFPDRSKQTMKSRNASAFPPRGAAEFRVLATDLTARTRAYHGAPDNRVRKDYFLAWWFD